MVYTMTIIVYTIFNTMVYTMPACNHGIYLALYHGIYTGICHLSSNSIYSDIYHPLHHGINHGIYHDLTDTYHLKLL
jgi:hypothetical protein